METIQPLTPSIPIVGQSVQIPPSKANYPGGVPSPGGPSTITEIQWDEKEGAFFVKSFLRPETWVRFDLCQEEPK